MIDMTAEWAEPSSVDDRGRTVSYRHPVPFTASSLAIVNVCAAHDALRFVGVDTDPWPDRPGYLKRPIPNASEAESLYVGLWGLHAQVLTLDTCGCVVHQVADEAAGTVTCAPHPRHTKKCAAHIADDDRHAVALGENRRRARLVARLMQEATLTATDALTGEVSFHPQRGPRAYFDNARVLHLAFRNLTATQRTNLISKVAAFDGAVVVD